MNQFREWIAKGYKTKGVDLPPKDLAVDGLKWHLMYLGEEALEKENAQLREFVMDVWAITALDREDINNFPLILKTLKEQMK